MPDVLEKPPAKRKTDGRRIGVKRKEWLQEKLAHYSRQPFMEVLAVFLQASPDVEQLRKFASEKPDKWASAVAAFSKMAGFTEKSEVQHNVTIEVQHMSDAQLLDEIKAMQLSIRDASPPLLEAVAVRVPSLEPCTLS